MKIMNFPANKIMEVDPTQLIREVDVANTKKLSKMSVLRT